MPGRRRNRNRVLAVRELWAKGVDSVEIQRIIALGRKSEPRDYAVDFPPCDPRTVRTLIAELRQDADAADAENAPHLKAQLNAVLRKNLARADRVYTRAMGTSGERGPQLLAAGRAIGLVNQTVDRMADLGGIKILKVAPVTPDGAPLAGSALPGSMLPDMRALPPEVRAAVLEVARAAKKAKAERRAADGETDPEG